MKLPEEIWIRMLLVVAGILLASALPLAALTPIRRKQGKDVKSMWIKYAAWFLMVPLLMVPLILGRLWMQAAFLLMSLYAFEEFGRAVGLKKDRVQMRLGRIGIVLLYAPVFVQWLGLFMAMPAYVILLIFVSPIRRDQYEGMIQYSCLTIFGVLYFGWFLAHLAFLMNADTGRQLILAFFTMVVVNDASAYLIGSSFGRHKLVPKLSPNKTIEGALGALAVTVAVAFLVRFALCGLSIPLTLLLGFLMAFGGLCGDLTISLIKRDVHIKDSGNLIPGHGGLLDRLDSVLFCSPIFFHLMSYFCWVTA